MAQRQPKWLKSFAKTDPDAYTLYTGDSPGSYRGAVAGMTKLLDRYATADKAEASEIKAVLFRIGAHLNSLATDTGVADVASEDFFRDLKSAADATMQKMTTDLHARAAHSGLDRELRLPKPLARLRDNNDGKRSFDKQDKYVAYIRPKFNKKVAKALGQKKYSMLDAIEVKAVMMLLHAGYINARLKEEFDIPELLGGAERYTEPDNKDLLRTLVKLFGDYKDPEENGRPTPDWNPHTHLLDLVRRSAHTERLEDQEHFIENIAGIKAGKGKARFSKFVHCRHKSTLDNKKATIKQMIVSLAYTPTDEPVRIRRLSGIAARATASASVVSGVAGNAASKAAKAAGKLKRKLSATVGLSQGADDGGLVDDDGNRENEVAATFHTMMSDEGFLSIDQKGVLQPCIVQTIKEKQDLDPALVDAAVELLHDKSLLKEPVTMIVEFQLYISQFLADKKKLHGIYKFGRPSDLLDLAKDLSKYATNKAMAYTGHAQTVNDAHKTKTERQYLHIGFGRERRDCGRGLVRLSLDSCARFQQIIFAWRETTDFKNALKSLKYVNRLVSDKDPGQSAVNRLLQYCKVFEVNSLDIGHCYKSDRNAGPWGVGQVMRTLDSGAAFAGVGTNLVELGIAGNLLGRSPETCGAVAKQIASLKNLKKLDISDNDLGTNQGAVAAEFARHLRAMTQLTELNIAHNTGQNKVRKWNKELHANVHEFQPPNKGRGAPFAAIMAPALEQLVNLEVLDVSNNELGWDGMSKFSRAVAKLSGLTSLECSENYIEDKGAKDLALAIKTLPLLQHVGIRLLKIGGTGGTALARAINELKYLRTFDCDGNDFGQDAKVLKLIDVVKGSLPRALPFPRAGGAAPAAADAVGGDDDEFGEFGQEGKNL